MSVMRKVPFIQTLIDDLSAAQKKSLLDVVNGDGNLVNASFSNMPNAGTVTPVLFQFNANDSKTGILILSSHYRVLIAYHRFQDLLMIKLNPNNTYEKVNEYLDINELRRILEEVDDHITPGEIDSGEADANAFLVANGDGGTEFISPEEGSAQYLLGLDSQGNIIKDELPEGIVVNTTWDGTSNNAVSNKAVADKLSDEYYDKDAINAQMETKANVDGNYPTMTVGVADQLSPYDEESGDDQDEPFILQGTGTANGTQSDFATGAIALMKEKQGNTVVVNQYAKELNSNNWYTGDASVSFSDGVATFTANAQYGNIHTSYNLNGINGHKYLIVASIKLTTATTSVRVRIFSGYKDLNAQATTDWQFLCGIGTLLEPVSSPIFVSDNRTSDWDAIQVKNVVCIDLTQWFNGDIPPHLLDHPENFFRYYQGSLAYNEGTLVNANGRYIKCIGMNQWDEEWELGAIDSNGQPVLSSTQIMSKNFIKVIPNGVYRLINKDNTYSIYGFEYDKDFNFIKAFSGLNSNVQVSSNASYIKFYVNGHTTYKNDISINLYYEDESRCLTYEPYEVLTNNDTGTETLRSAGNVSDSKAPDGTITRNVGTYTFTGSETWVARGTGTNCDYYYLYLNIPAATENQFINGNLISNKALAGDSYSGNVPYLIGIDVNTLYASVPTGVNPQTIFTSGTVLFYELATPLPPEQGTPYSENIVIDDFGSMDFSGTSGVPQGNLIFYPVDYKAFIDTLHKYTDGTPSKIALKSDLASDKSELQGVDSQLKNAIGGTLRQCLCVKESLDFDNTDFVDLGSLNWTYNNQVGHERMTAQLSQWKRPSGSGVVGNGLCSLLKTISVDYLYEHVTYGIAKESDSDNIFIYSSTMGTDATAFKNAMKGVLLAYEKASS